MTADNTKRILRLHSQLAKVMADDRWVAPGRAMIRGAVEAEHTAYLQALTYSAQRTTTNLQHLRDRHQQAQAVIEARRNRNTGPNNPRGADGRARRHQHPRKAAARNASPATQGSATPAFRGLRPSVVWVDELVDPVSHWSGIDPAWWQ